MIRRYIEAELQFLLENFPAVGLIGPRQVGKTTLVKNYFTAGDNYLYLDLEKSTDRVKLNEPEFFLKSQQSKTIILDEIQFFPELFPVLRSLIDEDRRPGKFVILGSASPALLRQSSESLAGRVAYLQLRPLNLTETSSLISWQDLWLYGGFPEPALKAQAKFTKRWYQNFIDNYIHRDLPALGLSADPGIAYRYLQMLASINGEFLNYSQLARSLGVSVPSAKTYFGYYENAFLVSRLQPWHANLKKRIIKSPRLYFNDTGMLHHLLGIGNYDALLGSINAGPSWEAFVVNQLRSILEPEDELFYLRTQDGAEIDFLVRRNNQWYFGAEIKLTNAPVLTKGTYLAMEYLQLPHLYVVTPEADNYQLRENIEVISLEQLMNRLVR